VGKWDAFDQNLYNQSSGIIICALFMRTLSARYCVFDHGSWWA